MFSIMETGRYEQDRTCHLEHDVVNHGSTAEIISRASWHLYASCVYLRKILFTNSHTIF